MKTVILDLALIFGLSIALTVVFGIFNSIRPEKIASTNTPEAFGLDYESVSFFTEDGIRIAGWYVPKKGGEGKSTVIALHGYPADKGDILSRVVFLADKYNLLLIDFRYFGESGGSYSTVGARETGDLAAAVNFALSRRAEKIGIYGFSMGGAVALMALPKVPAVDAVVAEASYAQLALMTRELYRLFGPAKGFLTALTAVAAKAALGIDLYAVSPADAVVGTDKPVLLIHGRYDKVIPFENAELIALSLRDDPNAEFWFNESRVHGEASRELPEKVGAFFDKHLLSP